MATKLVQLTLPIIAAGATVLIGPFGVSSNVARRITGLWALPATLADIIVSVDRLECASINVAMGLAGNLPIPCDIPIPQGTNCQIGLFDRAGGGLAVGQLVAVQYSEPD